MPKRCFIWKHITFFSYKSQFRFFCSLLKWNKKLFEVSRNAILKRKNPCFGEKIKRTQKLTGTGEKRLAQQKFAHKILNDKKITVKTIRLWNYIIVSKNHANITVEQNKLALSPIDSKRFILFEGVATVPFGDKVAEETEFLENTNMDTELADSSMKLITLRPNFIYGIEDFYSCPTQN